MSTDEPRRFNTREQLDQRIDDCVSERTDPTCDVPDCRRRWIAIRKLGWSAGAETFVVAFFVCHRHLRMPRAKFLKAAPTGIPGFDDAQWVGDVAPHN
jgi:hypothetical protein